MDISGVSLSNLAYSRFAELSNSPVATATEAAQQGALSVQDEIVVEVITSIQDQQKMIAEALIQMMQESVIDIYA